MWRAVWPRRRAEEYVHFVVEDFGLSRVGGGDEVLVQHLQDVLADGLQLCLHLRGLEEGKKKKKKILITFQIFKIFLSLNLNKLYYQ